jgi:hypothetical protein
MVLILRLDNRDPAQDLRGLVPIGGHQNDAAASGPQPGNDVAVHWHGCRKPILMLDRGEGYRVAGAQGPSPRRCWRDGHKIDDGGRTR